MAGLRNVVTWPDAILLALRQRLLDAAVVAGEHNVFLSLTEDQGVPPPTDLYATVVLGAQVPDEPAIYGGGNTVALFHGSFTVIVWCRLGVGQAHRDDAYLTDASLGALAAFRRAATALQLFDPVNAAGDYLLAEPLRLAPAGFNARPRQPQPGWGSIAGVWEASYLANLG